MERTYDVFEKLPDGTLVWRATVTGHEQAIIQLKRLASQNSNEWQVMHLPTKTVIATMSGPTAST
jgi:hypothetical protein